MTAWQQLESPNGAGASPWQPNSSILAGGIGTDDNVWFVLGGDTLTTAASFDYETGVEPPFPTIMTFVNKSVLGTNTRPSGVSSVV